MMIGLNIPRVQLDALIFDPIELLETPAHRIHFICKHLTCDE
jgi:hypothetical protein